MRKGFTIVELLIVIVVIAILATITIVTYNSIVKSAYNTQVKAGTRAYYDAILAYHALKGEYPQTQPEVDGDPIAMTCLGVGYKNQYCGRVTGTDIYEDALFNAQLTAFLKSQSSPVSSVLLPVPGESYVGAVYGIDTTSASSTGFGRVIEYAVHGNNADCGISSAWAYSSSSNATACEVLFEEVPPR